MVRECRPPHPIGHAHCYGSAPLLLYCHCKTPPRIHGPSVVEFPGLRVRMSPFCLPISTCLPVTSTRFPSINHGLHIKDKRVRVFSVYYVWAVYVLEYFNILPK
jgi:hypothetical protein